MSLILPRRSGLYSLCAVLVLALCGWPSGVVFADVEETKQVVTAITDAASKSDMAIQKNIQRITDAQAITTSDISKGLIAQTMEERGAEIKSEPDPHNAYLADTLNSIPEALVLVDVTTATVMANRLKELNLIAPNTAGSKRAAYLVDSSAPRITINGQIFDVFMRYFCDPLARGGTMAKVGVDDKYQVESSMVPGKSLGCGSVRSGGSLDTSAIATLDGPSSRDGVFGEEDTTPSGDAAILKEAQRNAIKNLPMRPAELFFEPTTFPIEPMLPPAGGAPVTNTNPLAPIYYGAFAQAMQFMIGTPPESVDLSAINTERERVRYIESQGNVARQMLASYPFALLFSERVGTLPATALGELLMQKIDVTDPESLVTKRTLELMQRDRVSMAEYMDLVMYRIPMSPGYLDRVRGMDVPDLQREKVWLSSMQTVLNYQRNRWLEILVALEAVK